MNRHIRYREDDCERCAFVITLQGPTGAVPRIGPVIVGPYENAEAAWTEWERVLEADRDGTFVHDVVPMLFEVETGMGPASSNYETFERSHAHQQAGTLYGACLGLVAAQEQLTGTWCAINPEPGESADRRLVR